MDEFFAFGSPYCLVCTKVNGECNRETHERYNTMEQRYNEWQIRAHQEDLAEIAAEREGRGEYE